MRGTGREGEGVALVQGDLPSVFPDSRQTLSTTGLPASSTGSWARSHRQTADVVQEYPACLRIIAGADRQAVLLEVVHVLDDHDYSRDEEEKGHGRQDLDGGPPERHGGDGEGDEEGNHSVSSPARGGATLVAQASRRVGYCLLHRSVYDVCHHWTFIWIRFRCSARSMGQHRPCFLCMQFASGVRDSVDSLASSLDTVLDQQVAGSLARLNFRLLMLILFPRRREPRHFGVADVQSRYVTCK